LREYNDDDDDEDDDDDGDGDRMLGKKEVTEAA
jgi:hypothetical protein